MQWAKGEFAGEKADVLGDTLSHVDAQRVIALLGFSTQSEAKCKKIRAADNCLRFIWHGLGWNYRRGAIAVAGLGWVGGRAWSHC